MKLNSKWIIDGVAGPGLHRKPLDAVIGRLLVSYRLGGRQVDNQQNDDATCSHFDGHFDGHGSAAVIPHASPDGEGSWLS